MSELIVPLYALRGRRRGYEVSVMKAMMDMMGLAGGPVRPPLTDVDAETAEALRGACGEVPSVAQRIPESLNPSNR